MVGPHLPLMVLAVGMATAVALHCAAGFHYPVPWDDEAHFLVPAQNLARHLQLGAPQLNAPAGIFWMPDGYAVVLAVIFAFLPDTETTARLVSLALALMFAGCLYTVSVRLGDARLGMACALAVWLVAPLVVLMANIARMEALVLALVGAALLCVAAGRWAAALAVVSLTPLVHPMGFALIAAFVLVAVLMRADLHPSGWPEAALIALTGLAWVAEAAWLAAHLDLVQAHLDYQLARKSSRGLTLSRYEVAAGLVAAVGLAGAVAARRQLGEQRAVVLATTCAVAGAFVVIQVVGKEMWYRVLSRETVLLLAALAVAVVWRPGPARVRPLTVALATALALVPIAAMARMTVNGSAFGMAMSAGTASRDHAFLAVVQRELRAFDARQPQPVVVALDWSSGLTPFLLQERWRNLRFVDPTPVTPLTRPPDYVLFSVSPAEPDWRRHIEDRIPDATPVLHVAFPDSRAALLLYPGDGVRLPLL
jgi:hypothetical protein